MKLLATNRHRSTGTNGNFRMKHWKLDSGATETAPLGFNYVNGGSADLRGTLRLMTKFLVNLGRSRSRTQMALRTSMSGSGGMADGFAKLLKLLELNDALVCIDAAISIKTQQSMGLGHQILGGTSITKARVGGVAEGKDMEMTMGAAAAG